MIKGNTFKPKLHKLSLFSDRAREVIEWGVQLDRGFPPRSKWTYGRFFTQLLFHNPHSASNSFCLGIYNFLFFHQLSILHSNYLTCFVTLMSELVTLLQKIIWLLAKHTRWYWVISPCQFPKKPRRWLLFNSINMQKVILLVTFNNVENHFSGYKKVMFISFTKLIGFSNKIFCLYKIENYSNYFLKYDFYRY